MSKLLCFFCFCLFAFPLLGQEDFSWWNNKHNWDGITSWQQYLIVSPGFMGPNALPVPEIKNGKTANSAYFETSFVSHFSDGDDTKNLFMRLYVPLFSDRVGLNLQGVPIERYMMDEATRDERRSREFDGKGYAFGDIYVGTFIQLVQESESLPDLLLTFNVKTASGSHFSAARYTDAPGYFFDFSAGKSITIEKTHLKAIRPHAMVGFNVYQTYIVNNRQNDAFVYGGGIDLQYDKFTITNACGGYIGYLRNGDSPLVYRLSLVGDQTKKHSIKIEFQQGFLDFNYTTFSLGYSFRVGFLNTLEVN